ncbi:MAG: hypothetical protein GY774_37495 [Planctomycetes bacterium]|nr:hypothetical protein [Planctomycetota bacterium]
MYQREVAEKERERRAKKSAPTANETPSRAATPAALGVPPTDQNTVIPPAPATGAVGGNGGGSPEPGELPSTDDDPYSKAIELAKEVYDKHETKDKGINENYAHIIDEGLR